jgi:hypothetical protein
MLNYPAVDVEIPPLAADASWSVGLAKIEPAIQALIPERFPGWRPEFAREWEEFWHQLECPTKTIDWNIIEKNEGCERDL